VCVCARARTWRACAHVCPHTHNIYIYITSQVTADKSVYCFKMVTHKLLEALPFFSLFFTVGLTSRADSCMLETEVKRLPFYQHFFQNSIQNSYGPHCYKNLSKAVMVMNIFPKICPTAFWSHWLRLSTDVNADGLRQALSSVAASNACSHKLLSKLIRNSSLNSDDCFITYLSPARSGQSRKQSVPSMPSIHVRRQMS
jgi:hypothetical protein